MTDEFKALKQAYEDEKAARLRAESDRNALVEEFSTANTVDELKEKSVAAIREMLPDAIMQMHSLLLTADNESTKAGLAKFIVSVSLDRSKTGDIDSNSALAKLVAQLKPDEVANE